MVARPLSNPDLSGQQSPSGAPGQSNGSFKLGRYDVLAPLPGRATDATYLCRHQAEQWGFERLFMLKLPPGESAEATASLMREARIGGLLNHSNVGRVIDVGSSSGRPFLVLDYVEGASLASLLAGTPAPPAAVVISMIPPAKATTVAKEAKAASPRPTRSARSEGARTLLVTIISSPLVSASCVS